MGNMYGVDVSHYQLDQGFDSSKIKADFIIAKATQGTTYKDPTMEKALTQAKNAGKLLGVYHFADGKTSGVKEADHFLSVVKPYIGKALLVLDWEADALKRGAQYALDFCDRVYEKTKVRPILYTSTSVVQSGSWDKFAKKYPHLWAAKYGTDQLIRGYKKTPDGEGINLKPFKEIIRQYSSNTYLEGYSDRLDADKAYISKTEWQKLCKKETSTTDKKDNKKKLSVEEIAKKIIAGEDGWKVVGAARIAKLKANGYDPDEVQKKINELLKASTKVVYHTVVKGENLTGIAKKYNTTIAKIKTLNPSIKSANMIKVGMKIRVK